MVRTFKEHWGLFLILGGIIIFVLVKIRSAMVESGSSVQLPPGPADSVWSGPLLEQDQELTGEERSLVVYGEDLIAHTSKYFGPRGSVQAISNGLNCQNCHLEAGRKPWGNNFGGVYATYPQYRARSGKVAGIYERIAGCFQRSLNGVAPDSNSREYRAMYAYMKWLGKGVPKGHRPYGSGIEKIPYLDRAADSANGERVFTAICQTCHGADGQGQLQPDSSEYLYPPLWGPHSYNTGAGLHRLGHFAGYIYNNMPYLKASHQHPKLTLEEAWDVAAFVNSQPRPEKDQRNDWPDISEKPIDFPLGPYADSFSARQHKYGPFQPIAAARKK